MRSCGSIRLFLRVPLRVSGRRRFRFSSRDSIAHVVGDPTHWLPPDRRRRTCTGNGTACIAQSYRSHLPVRRRTLLSGSHSAGEDGVRSGLLLEPRGHEPSDLALSTITMPVFIHIIKYDLPRSSSDSTHIVDFHSLSRSL